MIGILHPFPLYACCTFFFVLRLTLNVTKSYSAVLSECANRTRKMEPKRYAKCASCIRKMSSKRCCFKLQLYILSRMFSSFSKKLPEPVLQVVAYFQWTRKMNAKRFCIRLHLYILSTCCSFYEPILQVRAVDYSAYFP